MRAASEDPISAFEVFKARRKLQVTVAVIYCLLGAGVIFGYAGKTYPDLTQWDANLPYLTALKPVLIEEGVYREYCTARELEKGVRVFFEHTMRLSFMFTTAAVAKNVGTSVEQLTI